MELLLITSLLYVLYEQLKYTPTNEAIQPGKFKPVKQSVSGILPDGEMIGDCFPACIASCMGIDLEKVPLFSLKSQKEQLDEANLWLNQFDLRLNYVPNSNAFKDYHHPSEVYYIARGRSPRFPGFHMVIYKEGELVHDPHPDNSGIADEPTHFLYFLKSD